MRFAQYSEYFEEKIQLSIVHFQLSIGFRKGSRQAPGGGTGYGEVLIGADQAVAACEAHQPSALGTGGEQILIPAVNQAAQGPAHIGFVDLFGVQLCFVLG